MLVAIVGGSGSGKSWLADKLADALAPEAARLSLDDFYRDRSHLSPARRARLNFDHPRSIDWPVLEAVLRKCSRGGAMLLLPCYDFKTHCRRSERRILRPKPIILVDGLWLLIRPSIRSFFAFKIFLDCSARTRFRRRLARDRRERGRTKASVKEQFRQTVEPMHRRYVAPQAKYADVVWRGDCAQPHVRRVAALLRTHVDL